MGGTSGAVRHSAELGKNAVTEPLCLQVVTGWNKSSGKSSVHVVGEAAGRVLRSRDIGEAAAREVDAQGPHLKTSLPSSPGLYSFSWLEAPPALSCSAVSLGTLPAPQTSPNSEVLTAAALTLLL